MKIKKEIKKLAKEFYLKYNENWFKHIWVSKRDNILIEYIHMCPDPIYSKYGKDLNQRIKKIKKFYKSKLFIGLQKRYGGQVLSTKGLNSILKSINKIKDKEIKEDYLRIYKIIKKELGKQSEIALLTKTKIKKQKEHLQKTILLHEWIHILINQNKIRPKNWKYNEGLCTFFENYILKNLDELESILKKIKYPMTKQYYIHAIKFRNLVTNKKNSRERKETILNFLKRLK